MYDLKFVNLGITIEHMVSSVNVFGFRIAFYGIIIGIGMLLGIMLAAWDAEDRGLGEDVIYDHVFWVIVIGIMGARLYYVFFQWDAYKDDLLQILNLRAGGLAIYGGVIAGLITLYVLCRRKKLSFLDVADSLILAVLVGQILGRWGNFFNCEAFGRYTESLFAMRIAGRWVKRLTKKQQIHTGRIISINPPGTARMGAWPRTHRENQVMKTVITMQKNVFTTRLTRISNFREPGRAPHFLANAIPHWSVGMKQPITQAKI